MIDTPHSLLERLAQNPGDPASWNRLVVLYTPFLRHWLHRFGVHADADADDVIQNVLTVLVKKVPDFVHNQHTGAFRKWLRNTLHNCLWEFHRKAQSIASDAPLGDLEDSESELSRRFDAEHREHITKRLIELAKRHFPADMWKLFEEVVLDGHATAEVAQQNGVTPNVVYLAKSRILKWLRQEARGLLDDVL